MDEHFKRLEKEGKNSVDGLLKWMQDSKVIEASEEAEEKTRKLFADVKDKNNVNINKFKEVLHKVAAVNHKSLDEITTNLSQATLKIPGAFKAAMNTFGKHLKDDK